MMQADKFSTASATAGATGGGRFSISDADFYSEPEGNVRHLAQEALSPSECVVANINISQSVQPRPIDKPPLQKSLYLFTGTWLRGRGRRGRGISDFRWLSVVPDTRFIGSDVQNKRIFNTGRSMYLQVKPRATPTYVVQAKSNFSFSYLSTFTFIADLYTVNTVTFGELA
eukprot:jgi/Mesen1/6417/ME000329S05581